MHVSRRAVMLGGLGLAGVGSSSRGALADSPDSALATAIDAYVYGYPLVLLDVTRRQLTNVEAASESRAPMGQLLRMRSYPAVDDHSVPAPNADTLYTYAWLDLAREPRVVSIPDMGDRYFMMPMLSGWSDVFQSPGTRTTGQKPQQYAITGPRWSGQLPAGVVEYKSPTDLVWMLGRIYCTGTAEDYAKVHALQDAVSLAPLSHYGKPYRPQPGRIDPTVDMRTPPVEQVNGLGAREYFSYLARLMKTNPAQPRDSAIVARMASIGLAPEKPFDPSKLSAADRTALESVPKLGQQRMFDRFKSQAPVNGWIYFGPSVANWGTDYLLRGMANMLGPGWNIPADAVYPASEVGPDGKVYDGSKRYVLRFEKGQMPPVNGFWSLTLYDEHRFFVPNPLNRYVISQRDKLAANADGSTDIYLQAESPGVGKDTNWLPAPRGTFGVMLRLYWPKDGEPSILNGTWKPPAIRLA